jgi:hypothetical protein
MHPKFEPLETGNKLRPEEISQSLDARSRREQCSFQEAYSQTLGGRGYGIREVDPGIWARS